MALKELRGIPTKAMPQVIKTLHSLKESILVARVVEKKRIKESWLCGIWMDDRGAEEIIEDIHAHRSGFGNRRVEL